MPTLKRLQGLPLGTRKFILWLIVAGLILVLLIWAFNNFSQRLKNLEKEEAATEPSYSLDELREMLDFGISKEEIKESIKELEEVIKQATST